VPLKGVEVDVEVRDHVASVVSTLNYENSEDNPLEVVFVFPLPGDAAVCHFSAAIGQKQIVAEVKEKQQAHEEYDDALSSGQQAFLLEESDESPDIFSLRVGSLPPGQTASIRLEYVIELALQADHGLRFCLPTVLNPPLPTCRQSSLQCPGQQPSSRSGALHPGSEAPSVLYSSCLQGGVQLFPGASGASKRRENPDHRGFPLTRLLCVAPCYALSPLTCLLEQPQVKLAAGHKCDRDVELLIYYLDAHQPPALVEAGQTSADPLSLMGDPVVMLSLYPDFPQAVLSSPASCGEFVFLLDCSGSMGSPLSRSKTNETRIASARDTLLLLLKSLPMGCYFNIYTFGSSFEHIFPCFSFGIGEGASSALINGLAREGGGHVQFITGTDRMQPKNSAAAEGHVTLNYSLAGQPYQNKLHFSLNATQDSRLTVHRLAARTLIRSLEMEGESSSEPPSQDPLLQLVSLQTASGCWSLDSHLAAVLGKTIDELQKAKPQAKGNKKVMEKRQKTTEK
ncbi:unnamed protein product, partial [Tetraodon nigroviridis]